MPTGIYKRYRRAALTIALPNAGSGFQTPGSLAIDLHYIRLQLVPRWNWERYARLCNFLKLTPHELASLVTLPHSSIAKYKTLNALPFYPSQARSYALLLTLLEANVCGHLTKDVIENPFPDLNNVPHEKSEPVGNGTPDDRVASPVA